MDPTASTWSGARAPHGAYPPPGTWVVYALLDDDGTTVYVGMSRALAARLRHHRARRPQWTHWEAQEATDENHAASLEVRWITVRRPSQNRTGA